MLCTTSCDRLADINNAIEAGTLGLYGFNPTADKTEYQRHTTVCLMRDRHSMKPGSETVVFHPLHVGVDSDPSSGDD